MDLPFIKKFDIRGRYGIDITDKDGYYLGLAIARTFHLKHVLIGWDTRVSSKLLAFNFINALRHEDISLSYIEDSPIEYITCASNVLNYDLSVMFTGSHNGYDWTGLLMHLKGGESVRDELFKKITDNYNSVINEDYSYTNVNLDIYHNDLEKVESVYEQKLKQLIPLNEIKEMSIVIDLGDGSGRKSLDIMQKLLPQVKVVRINDRDIYDQNSSHTADPSIQENMKDLVSIVRSGTQYTAGFAFDSDADRVLGVDENGVFLDGSILGGAMLYTLIKYLNREDFKFGYAVEAGPSMYNSFISLKDMVPDLSQKYSIAPVPVGRSVIRGLIRTNDLDFGIEEVGHFYSKEFFETDSSIYALLLILVWLSKGHKLSDLLTTSPEGIRNQGTVLLGSYMDRNVMSLYKDINDIYANMNGFEVDGIRGEIYDEDHLMTGWFCIRHSGYEKLAKFYYGSIFEHQYNILDKIFKSYINHE